MDDYESLSHNKWECKYHVVFIPKFRRKTLYVELRRHLGEVFRRLAEQKESRSRMAIFWRSRAHVDLDPAEIRRVAGDRVHQRQKRDLPGSRVWREKAQLRRSALLGARVLRIHSWTGRRGDTGLHQEARGGRQAPEADESVALTGHLQVATKIGVASATPKAALSGPHPKAPGSAGGYLLIS